MSIVYKIDWRYPVTNYRVVNITRYWNTDTCTYIRQDVPAGKGQEIGRHDLWKMNEFGSPWKLCKYTGHLRSHFGGNDMCSLQKFEHTRAFNIRISAPKFMGQKSVSKFLVGKQNLAAPPGRTTKLVVFD